MLVATKPAPKLGHLLFEIPHLVEQTEKVASRQDGSSPMIERAKFDLLSRLFVSLSRLFDSLSRLDVPSVRLLKRKTASTSRVFFAN